MLPCRNRRQPPSLISTFCKAMLSTSCLERIHQAGKDNVGIIIINAASLTHTSIALRDALLGVNVPFIEVHISNVFAREEFRHHSFLSDISSGCIIGLGTQCYELALQAAIRHLQLSN